MHYLTIMLTLFVFGVQTHPYIEIKTEHTFKDFATKDQVSHTRFGYEKKTLNGNKVYVEAGHMTGGSSWEAGYNTRLSDTLTIKGKVESKRERGTETNTKLETEIRFTW